MQQTAESYLAVLERIDRWFEDVAGRHPGIVPCRSGCSACCHGPFDISVADALLLEEGIARLSLETREEVRQVARRQLDRMRQLAPEWGPPYDVRALPEERFDQLTEALADEPCPLLDPSGACRVYAHRPLVCRLIGLPMMTAEGEILENACPIQEQFPDYALLDPQLFDLMALEAAAESCLPAAARARLGSEKEAGFETVIAAVVGGV